MKKYVLSAVVTGLLAPAIYAMDEGAAPAVEVEVAVEEVTVEDAVSDEVVSDEIVEEKVEVEGEFEVTTLEVAVEGEVEVAVDDVDLVRRDAVDDKGEVVECYFGDPTVEGEVVEGEVVDPAVCYTFGGAEGGELILMSMGPVEGGEVVEGGEAGGEAVEGEAVDPNLVDLASQSGIAEGGAEGEAVDGEVTVTSLETTSEDNVLIRSFSAGGIQPNFRGGTAEMASDSASDDSGSADADTQLLNDEQRGAVRGLRSDEEPAKSRSGLGKFVAKFRKPKSEVTLASAKSTDKALSAKLAEVDRMRDTALRTGDKKMLAKADKLEKELRAKAGKVSKIPTRTK